ncbi:MAG TPA: PilT/PilU family type 4a pilus ATPase [Kiritimatiellae bacterium]|nr:PilT/PilU family type 4a pilus ATPase [Kiritimatiellia bacterium]
MSPVKSSDVGINDLLNLAVEKEASDVHIAVGAPPILRIHGRLTPLDCEPLKPEDTERMMKGIASSEHQQAVRERGGVDFGFGFGDKARFRVSVFRQKGYIGVVMRQIPKRLMTLEEIGLPPPVKELLFKPRGIVLVTGPTGSGKTTTLASMINVINEERRCHIITIEDPIEYYHAHKNSIITQREVGVDVPTFSEAVIRGLRQDPDVMLIGEMRDLETMAAALTAAETGHLVFATLHTTGAANTVDRIVDAFPVDQQEQIRIQLANNIMAVISKLLLIRRDRPGRIAAFEVMVATPSIRAMTRDKKTFRISSDIQTGARWGMVTLDAHLTALYEKGYISYEDLITKSQDPDSIVEKLESQKGKRR